MSYKAYEIKSPQGRYLREYPATIDVEAKTSQIEQEVIAEEWYQISIHNCYHDEGQPCEPWQVVASKGEVPEE